MRETKFKMTEVGLMPEDWEVKSIRDIALINHNDRELPISFYYIDLESVKNGVYTKTSKINRSEAPSRAQRTIAKNDILYQTVRPYQKNNFLVKFEDPEHYIASTGYAIIRCINGNVPEFIYNCLIQDRFVNIVLDNCTGTSYPAINPSKLSSFQVPLPPLAEQQRIAKALSDVDELISSLDALIEKKRDIKKGTMQQLLTGKKRLPGFTEPWVEKKLGEIVDIVKGEQLNRDRLNDGAKYPVYNGGISPSGFHNAYNTEGNTVIISEGGNSCGFVNYVKENFWRGGHCYALFNFTGSINFLYQLLKYYENSIMKLRAGSGLPNIQKNNLCSFVLEIPSKAEQSAIASILTSMDEEISALEAKRDKYISIKQGMMQELLTGKIRLV